MFESGVEISVCNFCYEELNTNDRCHIEVENYARERIAESPINKECTETLYKGTLNPGGN